MVNDLDKHFNVQKNVTMNVNNLSHCAKIIQNVQCAGPKIIYRTFGFFFLKNKNGNGKCLCLSRSAIQLKQCLPAGSQTLQQKVCAYWNPYFFIILYFSSIFTIGAH